MGEELKLDVFYVHRNGDSSGLLVVAEDRRKAKQFFLRATNLPSTEFFNLRTNKVAGVGKTGLITNFC